jgi:hypothetical protein
MALTENLEKVEDQVGGVQEVAMMRMQECVVQVHVLVKNQQEDKGHINDE